MRVKNILWLRKKTGSKKDINEGKVLGAISYLWIIGPIILLAEKKNEFVKFHARQGTALFLLSLIPMLMMIIWIVNLYGIITALQGKQTKIPIAYEIGEWIGKMIKVRKCDKYYL